MNRQDTLIVVATGVVCTAVGYLSGVVMTEKKVRAEYEESARSYRRVMSQVIADVVEAPAESEEELRTEPVVQRLSTSSGEELLHDPITAAYSPSTSNPYHATMQEFDKAPVEFSSEPNDAGISYIDEDEYLEEDGRFKGSVVMVMSAEEPTFFMDGTLVANWEHMLGASIVQDFVAMVPRGPNPILYVRNHNTDSDYELTPELP